MKFSRWRRVLCWEKCVVNNTTQFISITKRNPYSLWFLVFPQVPAASLMYPWEEEMLERRFAKKSCSGWNYVQLLNPSRQQLLLHICVCGKKEENTPCRRLYTNVQLALAASLPTLWPDRLEETATRLPLGLTDFNSEVRKQCRMDKNSQNHIKLNDKRRVIQISFGRSALCVITHLEWESLWVCQASIADYILLSQRALRAGETEYPLHLHFKKQSHHQNIKRSAAGIQREFWTRAEKWIVQKTKCSESFQYNNTEGQGVHDLWLFAKNSKCHLVKIFWILWFVYPGLFLRSLYSAITI